MRYLLFLLVIWGGGARAQYQGAVYHYDGSVPVTMNNVPKSSPWCGGFETPQVTMGDLNYDGKMDMVIYERFPATIKTFMNTGTPGNPYYVFEPKYIANFPGCSQYLILADYDNDNIPDLFTHGGSWGFIVYNGYYNSNNELCFTFYRRLMYDNDTDATPPSYAHVKNSDIPSIIDVDHDGDLDFFAYDANGRYVLFYKNYREEDGLPDDSIRIRLADRCWGKIRQDWQRTHNLPYACYNAGLLLRSSGEERDGNNAICLFDADGDTDYDMLEGNNAFSDIQFFRNARVQNAYPIDSMDYQDTIWKNVFMPQYPAAFYIDADQDGKKDIIITPQSAGSSENYKTMQWFRNTGTTNIPVFTYQTDTFLVSQAIDAGTGAHPLLYDYNRDGKPDLLVGSEGYYQAGVLRSRLAYYRNTSTGPGNPSFEFQSYNLLKMDTLNLKGSSLAAGDINNDGKDDLLAGQTDGTITWYTNTAASNAVQPVWANPQVKMRDINNVVIDIGTYATPCIYDVDFDGKPDLVIGTMLGYFAYYQNVSTVPNQLRLKKINARLGDVKVDPQVTYEGYSTPFIGKIDDSGIDYLVSGSSSGAIYRYSGFQTGDTSAGYTMLDSVYSYIKGLGNRSAPAIADIDGDGLMDMVVGTHQGGLLMYRQIFSLSSPGQALPVTNAKVTLYPNPAQNTLYIQWPTDFAEGSVAVSIINALGQKVLARTFDDTHTSVQMDISGIPSGVYFCFTRSGEKESANTISITK